MALSPPPPAPHRLAVQTKGPLRRPHKGEHRSSLLFLPPHPPSLTGGSTEPGSVADGGRQPPARGRSAGFIPPLPGGTEPERGATAAAAAVPPPVAPR